MEANATFTTRPGSTAYLLLAGDDYDEGYRLAVLVGVTLAEADRTARAETARRVANDDTPHDVRVVPVPVWGPELPAAGDVVSEVEATYLPPGSIVLGKDTNAVPMVHGSIRGEWVTANNAYLPEYQQSAALPLRGGEYRVLYVAGTDR